MRKRLAKAKARIERDAISRHPCRLARRCPIKQKITHLAHYVRVHRGRLHRRRPALHVHQHHAHVTGRANRNGTRVRQRRHIVDDARTGSNCRAHDRSFARVNRHTMPARGKLGNHRHHPIQLLLHRNRRRTGARRFATNVDDVRALRNQPLRVRQGR